MIAIKKGQVWRDKKNGNELLIIGKHHDISWNCQLTGSKTIHKMKPWSINKFFTLIK